MARKFFRLAIVILMLLSWLPLSLAESPLPVQKQTVLGLYVTAKEAHKMWLADKDNIKILDVRTPEEYVFIGHAPMAQNIPFQLFNYKMAVRNKGPLMKTNPNFIAEVGQKKSVGKNGPGSFLPPDIFTGQPCAATARQNRSADYTCLIIRRDYI